VANEPQRDRAFACSDRERRKDRLALVAPMVGSLGHEVIAREIEVEDVGPVTARERPTSRSSGSAELLTGASTRWRCGRDRIS
jgi:hypothetical protein